MCEIIGFITEIVSNRYHLHVLIQKVIALQRLLNFLSWESHFSLNSMAEKGRGREYKKLVYTHIVSITQGLPVLCAKNLGKISENQFCKHRF